MLKKHSQLFEALLLASDLIVVSVAWIAAYWIRFRWGVLPVDKGVPPFVDYFRMLIFVWLIWAFVFKRFGLYMPMRRMKRFHEVWLLLRANLFSILLIISFTYLFREKSVPFSRAVFVIFGVLSISLSIAARSSIRTVLRAFRRRGFNLRHVLIVGSGELAGKVAKSYLEHPEYGVELIGCLTRNQPPVGARAQLRVVGGSHIPAEAAAMLHEQQQTVPIIGIYEELPEIIESGRVDQVIVALPLEDNNLLKAVVASIGDSMVDVKIVPDLQGFIQLGAMVEDFEGLPMISIASTPLSGINRFTKRVFDMLLGTVLFVLALPLMLLIAAVVKLTSKGPVLFSQERVGLDGKTFSIYKFRTMAIDAEAEGARFAVRGDPRVTGVGKLLRRTSMDELPQLWNVIRGDMSLVGPRPERPVFIDEFRQHIPKYMLRHKVQAGMTGWAQVNGWRGNTSIEKRIEHDLYYIENWSLLLDLKILARTFFATLSDRNAY